jgi:apoptosis-inducing factor 2
LQNNFYVRLIAKTDFESIPSLPRLIGDKDFYNKMVCPHKSFLKNIDVVNDEVIELTKDKIYLKSGEEIDNFDIVVVSTGSCYELDQFYIGNDPDTNESVPVIRGNEAKEINFYQDNILTANDIVVIGAGACGIEVTGTLLSRFPNKKITIISLHSKFLDRLAENIHETVFKYFTSFENVNLVFEERVEKVIGKKVITNKNVYTTDLIFACTGFQPRTKFMREKMMENLSDDYFIKINSFFQFHNTLNFFSGGDVTCTKEEKLAQFAEEHGEFIYKNIQRLYTHRILKKYKSKQKMMVLSMGPKNIMIYDKYAYMDSLIVGSLKNFIDYKVVKFK